VLKTLAGELCAPEMDDDDCGAYQTAQGDEWDRGDDEEG